MGLGKEAWKELRGSLQRILSNKEVRLSFEFDFQVKACDLLESHNSNIHEGLTMVLPRA